MDRDELVRLAGEQALLAKEAADLRARHARDNTSLTGLLNDINMRKRGWLPGAIELLQRIDADMQALAEMDQRLAALRKLTGL